ncbi:MAG: hypothetical protein F6K14_26450 [Symploca sp. SIO2C1]|nr:hypothetical protein [Symploca sp. SIO2C1]
MIESLVWHGFHTYAASPHYFKTRINRLIQQALARVRYFLNFVEPSHQA